MKKDSGLPKRRGWFVEQRGDHYFVVCPHNNHELVTVFDYLTTAEEICAKYVAEYPHFQSIPICVYKTSYPRPGTSTIMPKPYPRKVLVSEDPR